MRTELPREPIPCTTATCCAMTSLDVSYDHMRYFLVHVESPNYDVVAPNSGRKSISKCKFSSARQQIFCLVVNCGEYFGQES
jgi:hypothetical protein